MQKVGKIKVVPVSLKIIFVLTLFILFSNLLTNYINLTLTRAELIDQQKELLARDLKDLRSFADIQYEISLFNNNFEESLKKIEEMSKQQMQGKNSIVLGIKPDGEFLFESNLFDKKNLLTDEESKKAILESLGEGAVADFLIVKYNEAEYLSVVSYNKVWDSFIVRGDELNEFYESTEQIFYKIIAIIVGITLVCVVSGAFIVNYLLRFVGQFTEAITGMMHGKKMSLLNLDNASNDDITFMGAAFNSLSSSIDNLIAIFSKFATKDVVETAYEEQSVALEGEIYDLVILFSDIRGFTNITETLGVDIIRLLNMHYEAAIGAILEEDGIIGSIIGDAILAVFGVRKSTAEGKEHRAIRVAYELQEVASRIRFRMNTTREKVEKERGELNEDEQKVYDAVLLEIGVGIDGGNVFYGNIGSSDQMTNTVIGDNVNSASRLEGLTRVYHVPVLCSEYVKEGAKDCDDFIFLEVDTVAVYGKSEGKKIYWPIPRDTIDSEIEHNIETFSEGRELYYQGKWKEAGALFERCTLELADEFKIRVKSETPSDWDGIWKMTKK